MRYASICSGVEAASLAWESLGWTTAWFAEIEPFPSAVLAHHWPDVPNYGDMTKLVGRILTGEIEAPDILVGGTPCQAFSVAGLRGSLEDDRGNLTLTLVRILNAIDFIRSQQGKPAEDCPDGPRYKAIGNSMAVPVMRWIGKRINDFINTDGMPV